MTSVTQPYLVAVSGGIDSMVLLHMLHAQDLPLVVAHVDHGIREDAQHDADHVARTASQLGLSFVTTQLQLGRSASEDTARMARYAWLRQQADEHNARAIVTAHHADDLVETIILNVHRGTGWRGLASLRPSSNGLVRPLLHIPKVHLVRYAIDHNVSWRDDHTNEDVRYTRNYIRHGIAPKLTRTHTQQLLGLHGQQVRLREAIEREVSRFVVKDQPLSRHLLIMSPPMVAEELLAAWIGYRLERPRLRRLIHFARTARSGAKFSLDTETTVRASKQELFVSRG